MAKLNFRDMKLRAKLIGTLIPLLIVIFSITIVVVYNQANSMLTEAARAGRHGKGFAVVAEEVRSLAARSAKAAQETSVMIEYSIKTVDRGADLVQKTGQALIEIQLEALKVADIIGEINTSSNEQAQGIAQINEGLSQIDRVTQTNTASAAEQLSGQASQLRELVDRFSLSNNSGGGGSYSMRLNSGRNRSLSGYNA